MKTKLLLTAAVAATLCVPASGRVVDPPLKSAAVAWDRGDYVAALTTYLSVLDTAGASDADLAEIALQTGELYRSTELTTDGANPRFSPDGRYATYDTGTGAATITKLVAAADDPKVVRDLRGWGAVFSPDGSKLAYLRLSPTPELTEAQALVDRAAPAERGQRLIALNDLLAASSVLAIHDVASGVESTLDTGGLRKSALLVGAGDTVLFRGAAPGAGTQIYSAGPGRAPVALTSGDGDKVPLDINAPGTAALYAIRPAGGGRGGAPGGRGGGPGGAQQTFGLVALPDGRVSTITGSAPAFSGDGRSLTYIVRAADESRLMVGPVADPASATVVRKGPERLDAPAISRDGSRLAVQVMTKDDWEIFTVNRDGSADTRVTREIQHDILPKFLSQDRLLATVGEPRHRRSYVYDLSPLTRTRLFHNNTVRTIAPEYAWVPNADGTKILIVSERDGDTVSQARGVYLLDLTRRVTRPELRARVQAQLSTEQALRARGTRMFAPIAAAVRQVVDAASVTRVFGYEKAMFDFDSKHVSQPGNTLASAYLSDAYKSFGYEPEFQWFDARGALGGQSANVVATLKGTVNPDLVYVVSSHYDSVAIGPGADDDTSGTAALLEAARIMAAHPQPATIVFASFTGEEAGLLGSREFVRRAVADKVRVVGALNNDMIGWANDHRLDNTIRYSNPGLRDVQHAAAMQFTRMITYDALYFKSTDAAAYYEAYGDIVGGLGSYPVLGNPHYHQAHDLLETINHQLVTEVAKTTAATLMLMASSPSRLTDLKAEPVGKGSVALSWAPAPEAGVTGYIIAYGPPSRPDAQQVRVTRPSATLTGVSAGTVVSVKAVTAQGLEGWDWARVTLK